MGQKCIYGPGYNKFAFVLPILAAQAACILQQMRIASSFQRDELVGYK